MLRRAVVRKAVGVVQTVGQLLEVILDGAGGVIWGRGRSRLLDAAPARLDFDLNVCEILLGRIVLDVQTVPHMLLKILHGIDLGPADDIRGHFGRMNDSVDGEALRLEAGGLFGVSRCQDLGLFTEMQDLYVILAQILRQPDDDVHRRLGLDLLVSCQDLDIEQTGILHVSLLRIEGVGGEVIILDVLIRIL